MQAAGGAVARAPAGRVRRGQRSAGRGGRPWNSWSGLRGERRCGVFELNLGGGNFKAQFRRADKSGAPLGADHRDDELARASLP